MGVCESSTKDKEKSFSNNSPVLDTNKPSTKEAINEEENSNNLETYPSSNSQDNENKGPTLLKYDQDNSGKKSELSYINNRVFSNQNDEEIIIKGEINTKLINKERDFDNMDFKNLVKKNGGIVIKDKDQMSNVFSYQGLNPAFDLRNEKFSELKSMNSLACRTNITGANKIQGSDAYFNLINNRRQFDNINNNQINMNFFNDEKLRDSCKINISMHESGYRNDAFISIPKNDEPLPDIDELSTESPLLRRSSLISE